MRQPLFVTLAVLAATVAAAAARSATWGGGSTSAPKQLACMPVDGPTVFDKSFVQTTWAGLQRARKTYGVKIKYVTGQQTVDLEANMLALIRLKCNLIVPVGFVYGDATKKFAAQYPKQRFAIIDYSYPNPKELRNVRELTFQTDQAAFLAGYAAAAMTKTGILGTYGGVNVSVVTIFMNGFQAGMNYYNTKHNKKVRLLGWNAKTKTGLFTGDFVNEDNGRRTTESLLQQGADIIMPVAGQVGLGTLAALDAAHRGSAVWVDTDGCISASKYCNLILTSVEKRMDVTVFNTIRDLTKGKFTSGLYVGTLKNKGVSIAPFHTFDKKVPASIKKEITQAKAGIVSGKIKVNAWATK